MAVITVHARPGAVREALRVRDIRPIYVDYDGGCCEVCVDNAVALNVIADLRLVGFRVDVGPRHDSPHSDPTYAQAAQRILVREHRRRTP